MRRAGGAPAPIIRELSRELGPEQIELNRACPIAGGFTFVFDRAPDFFAWPDAVFDRYRYLGAFRGERLIGYACCGVAHGFTGAGVTPYFYATDMRVHPAARGAGLAMRLTIEHLETLPEDCPIGIFLIKEGNRGGEELMTFQGRFKRCMEQMRAAPFGFDSEEWNNLELYLSYLSNGLPLKK